MKGAALREWLEVIGIVAVVASLVFVGIEVRQSARAAPEDSFVGDLDTIIGVEELVVEARVAEYPSFEPEPIENVFRCGLN